MFTDCGFLMVGVRLVHSYIANVWRFGVWLDACPWVMVGVAGL